ncbi:hypothetical protein DXG01_003300 [Tephrocybe rancida]|nr:hypothetical protein DXG01_003300 [Tephrocybe rancida]
MALLSETIHRVYILFKLPENAPSAFFFIPGSAAMATLTVVVTSAVQRFVASFFRH